MVGFGQGGSTGGQAESLPLSGSQVFSARGDASFPGSQGTGRSMAACSGLRIQGFASHARSVGAVVILPHPRQIP